MSLNSRIDKENVVHLHNEYYSAVKKNSIMKCSGKWMQLEKIILSEVTQTQNNKYGMYSLVREY